MKGVSADGTAVYFVGPAGTRPGGPSAVPFAARQADNAGAVSAEADRGSATPKLQLEGGMAIANHDRVDKTPVLSRTDLLSQIREDIKQDTYYIDNFDNEGQRFLAWYLRNCCSRDKIQAREDITDGADDKEIDAVVVDDEKRQVVVIQGKFFAGSVDHQPLHEVLAAWLQMQDLPSLQKNCNNRLQAKLESVAEALKEDYDLVFELVTTGQLTRSASDDLTVFDKQLSAFEPRDASIILIDSAAIQARWSEAVESAFELPKLTHELSIEDGQYLVVEVANRKAVLATVPLAECLKFPGIKDGRLFRKNGRQSLGNTNKVNKQMKKTIQSDSPEHFFFYHNGITALCERLSFDTHTRKLKLEGLAVVNGCQSLTTVLSCSEQVKRNLNARFSFVFMKFSNVISRTT
jgi:hypothetical protein